MYVKYMELGIYRHLGTIYGVHEIWNMWTFKTIYRIIYDISNVYLFYSYPTTLRYIFYINTADGILYRYPTYILFYFTASLSTENLHPLFMPRLTCCQLLTPPQ